MTRRRWIADEFSDHRAALTGAHAAHLSRTLRARVGQEFEVACGDRVRTATVASVSDDRVEFTLGEEVTSDAVIPITLLLAVFKFDRMEWAIEKCIELNVTTIVPVIARRTEKHLALAASKRVERWRRIAREAAEQSRRASPPEILEPMKLLEALEGELDQFSVSVRGDAGPGESQPRRGGIGFSPGLEPWVRLPDHDLISGAGTLRGAQDISAGLRIVLAETERETTLTELLRARNDVKALALAVGPEGGWTPDELHLFQRSLWIAASLGDTILRTETAAIAALAIARAEI
jgi:16S rRNA (uracil1498-N3)-methyltransferase